MKTKGYKNSGFSIIGALIFFFVVAFVMQNAILVYDYIIKRTDDNVLIAVLMLIVVIIISSLCTAIDIIRRRITVDKPVKKILLATEKIARGDFTTEIDIEHSYERYDEYDLIAENINKMTKELRQSEVLKTDFISNVSHELKTPLAVITNYAWALKDSTLDFETRKKYSSIILTASKKLSDLVSNILKLNKLENQEIKPEYEKINLTEMLSEVILSYEDLVEKKKLELDCDLEDVLITSSPAYLEIVWNNLISNAIKFTDEGGKISISLTSDNGKAIVRISDTGCGISGDVGKRIFEKFYQGDTSHASEGNGLGLALVKKVIDILGGEISVKSEINKGTTFTIVLVDLA